MPVKNENPTEIFPVEDMHRNSHHRADGRGETVGEIAPEDRLFVENQPNGGAMTAWRTIRRVFRSIPRLFDEIGESFGD